MKTDAIFYQLFQELPQIFFDLIGKPDANIEAYQFLAPTLKQRSFSLDGAFVPSEEIPEAPFYFVEVQGYKEDNFYDRLFPEIFLYFGQYKPKNQGWYAIVIFHRRSYDVPVPDRYVDLVEPRLKRIYLNEIDPDSERFLNLGILKLIVDPPRKAQERAPKLAQQVSDRFTGVGERENMLQWIETILIYKFPKLTQEEIAAMLQLEELKNTRVYQDGRQQGVLEHKREMVPLLHELGLSAEQISDRLSLDLAIVQEILRSPS